MRYDSPALVAIFLFEREKEKEKEKERVLLQNKSVILPRMDLGRQTMRHEALFLEMCCLKKILFIYCSFIMSILIHLLCS